jgi:hypothetical protein
MRTILKGGIALGVLVEIWTYVMGFTGWYRDPAMLNLFWLVIPVQIAVLWWTLRGTAAEGRTYGGQVLAGTLASLIAGVVIVIGSYLFTTVAFPNYFNDLAAVQENMLRQAGQSEEQIRTAMEAYRTGATPLGNAFAGFIGTVVTGLVVSLVIAIFVRAKK